jgi:hypothetical protein
MAVAARERTLTRHDDTNTTREAPMFDFTTQAIAAGTRSHHLEVAERRRLRRAARNGRRGNR